MTALKLRIMPESLEINLEKLKSKLKESLKEAGALNTSIEEEDIAFGLKALIVTTAWPENLDTEKAEKSCTIEGVSSVQIIDYRRAFG